MIKLTTSPKTQHTELVPGYRLPKGKSALAQFLRWLLVTVVVSLTVSLPQIVIEIQAIALKCNARHWGHDRFMDEITRLALLAPLWSVITAVSLSPYSQQSWNPS